MRPVAMSDLGSSSGFGAIARSLTLGALVLTAGCEATGEAGGTPGPESGAGLSPQTSETPETRPVARLGPLDAGFQPVYSGIETQLLDETLVNFHVQMTGARDNADVGAYGRCAAAQYALIRGYGFARHVRTTVYKEGGVWSGDAVYTISPALPQGLQTLDAEVVVADCAENGIPTV